MALKNFTTLAESAKKSWSSDAQTVYEAASASFEADLAARADLGRMLAETRKARHISQLELAQLADVQQAEISKIERGLSNATLSTINRLAQVLQMRLTLS